MWITFQCKLGGKVVQFWMQINIGTINANRGHKLLGECVVYFLWQINLCNSAWPICIIF
jgi:hypothetical protein